MTTLSQAKKQVDNLAALSDPPARRITVNWEPNPDPPAPGVRVIEWGRPTITGPSDFIAKLDFELRKAYGVKKNAKQNVP